MVVVPEGRKDAWGLAKWVKGIRKCKLPVIKISNGDIGYSMGYTDSDIVLTLVN